MGHLGNGKNGKTGPTAPLHTVGPVAENEPLATTHASPLPALDLRHDRRSDESVERDHVVRLGLGQGDEHAEASDLAPLGPTPAADVLAHEPLDEGLVLLDGGALRLCSFVLITCAAVRVD
jgi:hypothetical protein